MKIRTIILCVVALMLTSGLRAQTLWHIFYDYWSPASLAQKIEVHDQSGLLIGSHDQNKEFGLGLRLTFFGQAPNFIRFSFMSNYRHIRLNDSIPLPDSAKTIQAMEYMIGAMYRSNKPTFHLGRLYSWFHAEALGGLGWAYNFDASISAGFSMYPIGASQTKNASGINLEVVYWPVSVVKSKNILADPLPFRYTIRPTFSLRFGFVFNSGIEFKPLDE